MVMNITKGIISRPVKAVIYGVEGIGKSTFASKFPDPLFFDLDRGSSRLDVKRVTDIQSWPQLNESIKEVYMNPSLCRTLVIDTADAAEQLCISYICDKYKKNGIEGFGYGAGYAYLQEAFARDFLMPLETCIDQGINVCILAHAVLKTVTLPDEMGQYDHWELKLSTKTTNKVAPLVKEWADLLLFANYETIIVTDDKSSKQKAQGGRRMMWASHTPFADAKNRFNLPDKMPFDYSQVARCIPDGVPPIMASPAAAPAEPEPVVTAPAPAEPSKAAKPSEPVREKPKPLPQAVPEAKSVPASAPVRPILAKLISLARQAKISEEDIRHAVAKNGYYPEDVPVAEYDDEFISGFLIGRWEGFKNYILTNRIPF